MRKRVGFVGASSVLFAVTLLAIGTAVADPCPSQFNLPAGTVCDFNGEICRSASEEIDGHTFCLMLGRLGSDEALEMDDIFNNDPVQNDASSVADANVFKTATACNLNSLPCNDPPLPQIAGTTYIDWNDLAFHAVTRPKGLVNTTALNLLPTGRPIGSVEDHRIVDYTANEDYSIFSAGASCVTGGSSVPKEDFTQSYLGNNDDFLYFAQERRTNSGNSVYYWMLNQEPPDIVSSPNCGANTRGELVFTLKSDDLQVIANFPSSSDPASGTVFLRQYNGPTVTLPADEAVFAAGWAIVPSAVKNFALVIATRTPDADDKIPTWGGFDSQGKAYA